MNKKTMTQESVFKGDMRVCKNHRGDKFYVIKDYTDEELELLKPEKEYVCHEYPRMAWAGKWRKENGY